MEEIFNEAANICGMAMQATRPNGVDWNQEWGIFFVEDSWALDE